MKEFDDIYVSWRPGQGKVRHVIGVLKKHPTGKYTFQYDESGVAKAQQEGFSTYTEFPDLTQTYNGTVLDVFAQRLMKSERSDIQSFYDFWEIDPTYKDDKYYMLAHTQGLLPTDNFEFLADYNAVDGLHFLTDLAHLTEVKLPAGTVKVGDRLTYKLDHENEYDDKAVKVFKGDLEVGFIKKIHSRVFYKEGADKLVLTVKAVEQNGVIRRIFLKVEKS